MNLLPTTTTLLFSILLVVVSVQAEQCSTDKTNPCKANCNGTIFDISHLFKYPYQIAEQYMWSPCEGTPCEDYRQPGIKVAVCQSRDYSVNCGLYQEPVFILQRTDPYYTFSIEYPSGSDWRISIFHFIASDSYPKTNILFTGEMPNLQYNFQVTGKCIGQPNCRLSGPNPFN